MTSKRKREELEFARNSMFIIVSLTRAGSATEKVLSIDGNDSLEVLLGKCAAAFELAIQDIRLDYAGETLNAHMPMSAQLADGASITLSVSTIKKKFHLSDVPQNVRYVSVSVSVYASCGAMRHAMSCVWCAV